MLAFALLTGIIFLVPRSNAASIEPRISNGNDATIGELPYLVSIQYKNVHVCGGCLLSDRWIISAARCYDIRPYNELSAEYGSAEITPDITVTNRAKISRGISHEEFDYASLLNDISLLESETPMITGFHEPFSKLAPEGSIFRKGISAVHAGWGLIRPDQGTTRLQKGSLHMLSSDECIEAQSRLRINTICAMGESVICAGDPGNPLFINGVLVGITTFRNGPTCESVEGSYPNIYTDVSKYIRWIEKHTGFNYQLSLFLHRQL